MVVRPKFRGNSGRRTFARAPFGLLIAALVATGLWALPGSSITGQGPNTLPNPNANSVQTYCTANHPGTTGIVISTGSASDGGINETVDNGYYLKWKETYTSPGVEAEIFNLKLGSAAGTPLQYVTAFSWVGGNDTYLFDIGTPTSSNTVGGTAPADSLTMTNFNGKNFTQWGFCAYTSMVPVSVTKTVAGNGAGTFQFTFACTVIAHGNPVAWPGYPLDVPVNVNGAPVTVSSGIKVPLGASCTVTEKAGVGDEAQYNHGGPQTKTTNADGANFAFTNTLKPGKISFTKKLSGAVDGETVSFTFALDCDNNTYDTTFTLPEGDADPLTWLSGDIAAGTDCTIAETGSTPSGAWSVNGSPTAVLKVVAGTTLTSESITNTRKYGYFQIAKSTNDDGAGTFGFNVNCGGVLVGDAVQVTAGGTSSVFGPYPTGTSCTIAEIADVPDNYAEAASQTFTVVESTNLAPVMKSFVNTRKFGKLTFTKVFSGAFSGQAFSFDFALTCSDAKYNTTFGFTQNSGIYTWTSGDIAAGVTCSVAETSALPVGAWTTTGSPTPAVAVVADTTTALADITNVHTKGWFRIAKLTSDDSSGTFTFDVVCFGITVGKGTQVAAGGMSAVFGPFPTGAPCTITERADDPDLYTEGAPVSFKVALSTNEEPSVITVTNVRKTGRLSFTKTVVGALKGEKVGFDFSLTCDDKAYNAKFSLPEDDDDPYTWLSGDLPAGISCSVTETASAPAGVWIASGSPTAAKTVVADSTVTIAGITNTHKSEETTTSSTTSTTTSTTTTTVATTQPPLVTLITNPPVTNPVSTSSTSTVAPTTAAPTSTPAVSVAGVVVTNAPTTTAAVKVLGVQVEQPAVTGGLSFTGSAHARLMVLLGLMALMVGSGLVAVTRLRRRTRR